MRLHVIAMLVAVALLVVAVALPTKRDTSIAAWWARVCYQLNFFARVALAIALVAAVVWFLLVPLFAGVT